MKRFLLRLQRLERKSPIIVMGMHRSGTSMLTRLMVALGFHMGRCLSENAESRFFQEWNRQIMAAAGARWYEIHPLIEAMKSEEFVRQQTELLKERLLQDAEIAGFFGLEQAMSMALGSRHGKWGWKDPRNTVTLPIWLRVFPRAKVIHMIRNGIDVAISLCRRESRREDPSHRDYSSLVQDFSYCFRLWEDYSEAGLACSKQVPPGNYIEVRYEQLLAHSEEEMQRLLSFLEHPADERMIKRLVACIDKGRLDNSKYIEQFQPEIAALPRSKMMKRLAYE